MKETKKQEERRGGWHNTSIQNQIEIRKEFIEQDRELAQAHPDKDYREAIIRLERELQVWKELAKYRETIAKLFIKNEREEMRKRKADIKEKYLPQYAGQIDEEKFGVHYDAENHEDGQRWYVDAILWFIGSTINIDGIYYLLPDWFEFDGDGYMRFDIEKETKKAVFCVSEEGHGGWIPKSVLEKYAKKIEIGGVK